MNVLATTQRKTENVQVKDVVMMDEEKKERMTRFFMKNVELQIGARIQNVVENDHDEDHPSNKLKVGNGHPQMFRIKDNMKQILVFIGNRRTNS